MRRLHLVVFALLIAAGSAPVHGAAPGPVTGSVRDSAGVPQIGAVVQLLRPDLTVIASVYTNSKGRYVISSVYPGRYAIKAMGASFLPSLRENVRVRAGAIVNLTLNSLYEVMQWLPEEPRAAGGQKDDWTWTLRSAANRPLLRWLEDGPLVVVSDGSGARPRLKARLMATGQEGTFGESGERFSAAVEETPIDSRELLARVDFAPNTDAGMESMLGFRQDLGFAGSVQSVAAVAIHPEIEGLGDESGGAGLAEAAIETTETIHLGDRMEAEAGTAQVLARLGGSGPTVAAALPFASAGWREGNTSVHYRLSTLLPSARSLDDSRPQAMLPVLARHNGRLVVERGMHQEIEWERRTDQSGMSLAVYSDSLRDPAVEARYRAGAGGDISSAGQVLYDPVSGMIRLGGPDYSAAGMLATFEHRLPKGNHIRLTYANGGALVMPSSAAAPQPALPQSPSLAQVLAAPRPRRVQTYSISLSGTLDGSGTRWRASYRWQPEDTVTGVAPFASDAAEPYLNLHLRQPIGLRRDGAYSLDALVDARNLLAQGYRPFILSDGSVLVFAQDQRGFQAGLAFTF